MARLVNYDPQKIGAAQRFVEGWALAQPGSLIDRVKAKYGGSNITGFAQGGSSVVSLGTNLALLQGGVFGKFRIVTRDRSQTIGFYLGEAIRRFAEGLGVDCRIVDADAIIAGKGNQFPKEIAEMLDEAAPAGTPVALIDGVAVGHPKPLPIVDGPINVPNLNVRTGRLHRLEVPPATADQILHTLLAMGANVDAAVSALDARQNLIEGLSFYVNYTAWPTPPEYRVMALAKMLLEERAVKRYDNRTTEKSRGLLVHNVGEGTPAIEKIAKGTLIAGASFYGRKKRGDEISPAVKGALVAACAVDPSYDPSADFPHVRREGCHLYLDRLERRAFEEEVRSQMAEVDRRVPRDMTDPRGGLPVDETEAILSEVMHWLPTWREDVFGALMMLQGLDNTGAVA